MTAAVKRFRAPVDARRIGAQQMDKPPPMPTGEILIWQKRPDRNAVGGFRSLRSRFSRMRTHGRRIGKLLKARRPRVGTRSRDPQM